MDDPLFWAKVDKTGECWLWTGSVNRRYGVVQRQRMGVRERTRSNRYAWILVNGPIPEGTLVCHTCDNPLCVRPDHLWLGTNDENMADMARKGRSHRVKTPEHIAAISEARRRAYREHPESHPGRKKTHCPAGHPYDEANTCWIGTNRKCRACHRKRQRERKARHRAALRG